MGQLQSTPNTCRVPYFDSDDVIIRLPRTAMPPAEAKHKGAAPHASWHKSLSWAGVCVGLIAVFTHYGSGGGSSSSATRQASNNLLTTAARLPKPLSFDVSCSESYTPHVAGCHPLQCGRGIIDDFVSPEVVATIRQMAEAGMAGSVSAEGGPVILDVNSGYRLDSGGLLNIYKGDAVVAYSEDQYNTYSQVFSKIRDTIKASFRLKALWFTAPTFMYVPRAADADSAAAVASCLAPPCHFVYTRRPPAPGSSATPLGRPAICTTSIGTRTSTRTTPPTTTTVGCCTCPRTARTSPAAG